MRTENKKELHDYTPEEAGNIMLAEVFKLLLGMAAGVGIVLLMKMIPQPSLRTCAMCLAGAAAVYLLAGRLNDAVLSVVFHLQCRKRYKISMNEV